MRIEHEAICLVWHGTKRAIFWPLFVKNFQWSYYGTQIDASSLKSTRHSSIILFFFNHAQQKNNKYFFLNVSGTRSHFLLGQKPRASWRSVQPKEICSSTTILMPSMTLIFDLVLIFWYFLYLIELENRFLYDLFRKIQILGKHTRRITSGCWSRDGLLALVGDDRTLTVSNETGDTVCQTGLRDTPSQLVFADRKQDVKSQYTEGTISLVIARRTLFLFSLDDQERPIELAFQQKYGDVVNYKWYGDGYVMIGFSNGYLIVISTHEKEIGIVSYFASIRILNIHFVWLHYTLHFLSIFEHN